VLISLLLSSLPPPHNAQQLSAGTGRWITRQLQAALGWVATLCHGRRAPLTSAALAIVGVAVLYTASQIRIGNPVEGSNLLWNDAPYNVAVRALNRSFPGVNTLEIVLEARDQRSEDWNAQRVETVQTMQRLQRLMEAGAAPPRASLSFADYLGESNRLFNGGHPAWSPMDPRQSAIGAAAVGSLMGASAKSYANVVDGALQHATVSLWYPDNRQPTVGAALAAARVAIAQVGENHEHFRVRLGTGTIALQEAVNRVIERYHWVVIASVNVLIFMLASLAYRSIVAGILLLIPVNLANQALIAAMHLLGVGLDVNSMIVAAIGVGVGIDYGIYLLSRICEELRDNAGNWSEAIDASLRTTGKAILFTATIMIIGILPWYLMSDLKFVADMGLLLIAIMAINMLLSLVLLPLLVWWVKPSFALRQESRLVTDAPVA